VDAQTAVIVGAAISGIALLAAQAITQITGIVRSRDDHAHDLRREQFTKYYELRLQEYRERREACEALLASTHHFATAASARQSAFEAMNLPRTPENLGAASAEAEMFKSTEDLASKYADQGLRLLRADEDAGQVVKAYQSLPAGRLLDSPKDKGVQQVWRGGVEELQQTIFDYLRMLRERLVVNGASEDGA
jgi:hypothetical protein